MFLAVRELRFAWGRFLLMGSVIALVAILTVMLSGLASGLVDDNVSVLKSLPATHLGFQRNADSTFSRSTVDVAAAARLARVPGVRAEPLGLSLLNVKTGDDAAVDMALVGMPRTGFVAAGLVDQLPAPKSREVVITQDLADSGLQIGDRLSIERSDVELMVGGVAPAASYGHVDIAYVALPLWQDITYGSVGVTSPRAFASVVALDVDEGADIDAAATAADLDVVTRIQAFAGSPGYAAEQSTMALIRAFLYVIAAMILGAFFTVWTIQRRAEIGLQKALGESSAGVVLDALGQVLIVLVLATSVGTAIGLGLGAVVAGGPVPFALKPAPVVGASVFLILSGAAGMLVAIRRITTVDPIIALGGAR